MTAYSADGILQDAILAIIRQSKKEQKRGKLISALAMIERVSDEVENPALPQALKICIRIATICNKILSVKRLNDVTYLRKGEDILNRYTSMCRRDGRPLPDKIFRLYLVFYNAWASYHQALKNYHLALQYLMKALKLINETMITSCDSLQTAAKTKLNLSALYSELRRYDSAVMYAEQSLIVLQEELKLRLRDKTFQQMTKREKKKMRTMAVTYVIAFYNIGVSEDSRGNYIQSIDAFQNAVQIGDQFLPHDHEVLALCRKTLSESKMNAYTLPISPIEPRSEQKSVKEEVITDEETIQIQSRVEKVSPQTSILKEFKAKESLIAKEEEEINIEIEIPKPKMKDRYYSEKELNKLQMMFNTDVKQNFISVDKYFYSKLSKQLNVSRDVRYMRPNSA
jgi:tetratricopeptide (TPR) repeat protein